MRQHVSSAEKRRVLHGKTVLVTGASSGIGFEVAEQVAQHGAEVVLVARSVEKLEALARGIGARGGKARAYTADLSDKASCDALLMALERDGVEVDILVNNAGRSIRRALSLSYERFHDFERTMQLNYFGALKLIMGLLPRMRARGDGHILNISSEGVQVGAPRFAAYVASKAALDAFSRVAQAEVLDEGVVFTTVYMPLVRTPMIAPTGIYKRFPTLSPEAAADLVVSAMVTRKKVVTTRVGFLASVLFAVAPRSLDRLLHQAYEMFPDSKAARADVAESHHDAP